jgi:uncharacterized protein
MEVNGFGLGLRTQHYPALHEGAPGLDWLEALTENYLVAGGAPLDHLVRLRERHPVCLHGVSLDIAGRDPIDFDYLDRVRELAARIEPWLISDHLCFTRQAGVSLHDLLPVAFNRATLAHVAARVHAVQDHLGRSLTLENVSSYLEWRSSDMTEWEFLVALSEETGCGLLLDVNNVYVSARNHGFAPLDYLRAIPAGAVRQIHLAGHTDHGDHVIDTHDAPVVDAVWSLYHEAIALWGAKPTAIERDAHIPPLPELLLELETARRWSAKAVAAGEVAA